MIHRILLSIIAFTWCAQALATFEIRDPAAEIYAEEEAAAAISERACFNFLVDSVERPEDYRAALERVRTAIGEQRSAAIVEEALRAFCVDHPKATLGQAAQALGAAGGVSNAD